MQNLVLRNVDAGRRGGNTSEHTLHNTIKGGSSKQKPVDPPLPFCVLACMLEAISIDANTRTQSKSTLIRVIWAYLLYSKANQAIIDNRIVQPYAATIRVDGLCLLYAYWDG